MGALQGAQKNIVFVQHIVFGRLALGGGAVALPKFTLGPEHLETSFAVAVANSAAAEASMELAKKAADIFAQFGAR